GLVRPLIEIERAEVETWLGGRGIAWREDLTNQDCAFARNKIRHQLLPALRSEWNPELAAALGHLAALAGDEEQFWTAYIKEIAGRTLENRGEALLARINRIVSLPRAVARRLIRHTVSLVKGDLRQIEIAHVEGILELIAQREGSGRLQVPGVDVFRSFDWVRFAKTRTAMFAGQDYELDLVAPGSVAVPGSGTRICLQVIEKKHPRNVSNTYVTVEEVDWLRVPGPLSLRNWRPGDQYQPLGYSREQKVKLLFQYARIPLWERRGWPILTSGGKIVWVRKFGPAAEYAAGPQTNSILRISEQSLGDAESDARVSTSV
ncbi:MAG: tRNA lysidine(34) synthetase TilS, partial [Bryobacteraceae bacterium]